jgi:hypothetical protein
MVRIGWSGASWSPSVAGVRIMPGLTQLTRMPLGPSSRQAALARPRSAHVLAVQATGK